MNIIGITAFDFKMENEEFARSLYARWDQFFVVNFEKIADKLLIKHDVPDSMIQIDKLELDLGSIDEENFYEYFPRILEEQLEEALIQVLYDPHQKKILSQTQEDYSFDILCRFLIHGSLPWNTAKKHQNINLLFLAVIKDNSKQLKAFLQTYGHYTGLQQRLVYQLNDPELEAGVRLLAPGESTFICSYINLLKTKYKELENNGLRESDHRNATWLVVYAYLLTNRSSYFNKKSFVITTIEQLAARFSLSYDDFLMVTVSDLDTQQIKQYMPFGLHLILVQLKKELSERTLEKSLIDATKLYRLLSSELSNNKARILSEDIHKMLLSTLSNTETCRRLLQLMNESQIISLVPIVIPDNSQFVTNYAQFLDKQHDHGEFQGKTGGEFRLLKWQIIFPVLLENRGVSFNRKYFVYVVINQVAAHYNMALSDLLAYLYLHLNELVLDKNLSGIFRDLLSEYPKKESLNNSSSVNSITLSITDLMKDKSSERVVDVENFILQLSNSENRRKITEKLSEEEHHYLLSLIIPSESYFVIPYTIILDRQQNNNVLEGKVGSGFSKIKWEFIYSVLLASRNQVFNKKHFVDRTLLKIAAHYNATMQDMIAYFYREKILENISLPFDLVKVFNELKADYIPGNKSDNARNETGKRNYDNYLKAYKILESTFGNDAAQKEMLQMLARQTDFVLFIQKALRTVHSLQQYLISELHILVDKKAIIRYLNDISDKNSYLSINDIIHRIVCLLTGQLNKKQQLLFIRQMATLAKTDDLLVPQSKLIDKEPDITEKSTSSIYLNNAGLVLLVPYLPRLFSVLSLTDKNDFIDENARAKAVFLMHFAVWEKEEASEPELSLNKLLTGLEMSDPIPQRMELTTKEKEMTVSLLNGVLQNWNKLKNSSVAALRESFLQRDGKLEEKEDAFVLTVEEKSYDMLIDTVPWNFKRIRMPWMKKRMEVKWR